MPHHSRSRNKSYSKDRKDHYNQYANYSEETHDKISLKNNPMINDSTLIILRLINGNKHVFKDFIKGHNKCW